MQPAAEGGVIAFLAVLVGLVLLVGAWGLLGAYTIIGACRRYRELGP